MNNIKSAIMLFVLTVVVGTIAGIAACLIDRLLWLASNP